MHRLILRLLLLAVFFNTAVGMPLHEAKHLREAAAGTVQAWEAAAAAVEADGDAHDEQADALCAWCAAHAHQAQALQSPADGLPLSADRAVVSPAAHRQAFVPSPGRWRFASRDPPAPT